MKLTLTNRLFMLVAAGAFCFFLYFIFAPHAFAQVGSPGGGTGSMTAKLNNPLNAPSISVFVQNLLRAVVAIGIPICVLFIVIAGFKFIVAQGNSEKLSEARRNFVHVVIGIAIFLGAWTLAQIVVSTLQQIGANV